MFSNQAQHLSEPIEKHGNKKSSKHWERDLASPHQCLFCQHRFATNIHGSRDNLEHMSRIHGLFVPNLAMVSDVESFLGYLSTIIREWHECLYCGISKDCTIAIQSHMVDTGHCKLNLEREPELLGFWEEESQTKRSRLIKAPGQELAPVSGKIATSNSGHQRLNRVFRRRDMNPAIRLGQKSHRPRFVSSEQSSVQLSRKEEMSLQNIGPQQHRALVLAARRSQKEEAVTSRASEWSVSRKTNKQKYDQSHGPLSWAKGGLHNLLPR